MDTCGRHDPNDKMFAPHSTLYVNLLISLFYFHYLPDFYCLYIAPYAYKQERLVEKAASRGTNDTSTSTPTTSVNGGSATNTPLTSLSAPQSREDVTSMAKLQIATDR